MDNKYKKSKFDITGITFISLDSDSLKSKIDFENKNLEFFLMSEKTLSGSVYQLEKSDSNSNNEKITEWTDDYHRDGDLYGEEETFDETNEVFEGHVFVHSLSKIEDGNFSALLKKKIDEFEKEHPDGDSWEFEEWLVGEDMVGCQQTEEYESAVLEAFEVDWELVLDENLFSYDHASFIVSWVMYYQLDSVEILLGFREKSK